MKDTIPMLRHPPVVISTWAGHRHVAIEKRSEVVHMGWARTTTTRSTMLLAPAAMWRWFWLPRWSSSSAVDLPFTTWFQVIARLNVVSHRDATKRVGASPHLRQYTHPTSHPFRISSAAPPAMEVDPPLDLAPVLEAASEFASYPGSSPSAHILFSSLSHSAARSLILESLAGLQNDASAKEFLDRFPLHTLFRFIHPPFSPFPSPICLRLDAVCFQFFSRFIWVLGFLR